MRISGEITTSQRMSSQQRADQSMGIKALLALRQELHSTKPQNALRGIEGLEFADAELKKQVATAVLIGGMAEAVWHPNYTDKDLRRSKDVDVFVLSKDFVPDEESARKIDFWLPTNDVITVADRGATRGKLQTWWSNENQVVLGFGVNQLLTLKPGLYIPAPDWIADMRLTEALARVDTQKGVLCTSLEVPDLFKERILRTMKAGLPNCIAKPFSGQVLHSKYLPNIDSFQALQLYSVDLEDQRGIKRFQGN